MAVVTAGAQPLEIKEPQVDDAYVRYVLYVIDLSAWQRQPTPRAISSGTGQPCCTVCLFVRSSIHSVDLAFLHFKTRNLGSLVTGS
jgi:hypothetical protein